MSRARRGWGGLGLPSLQARFLLGTTLVLVVLMAGVLAVVEHRQRAAIIEEVRQRGEVIARSLAATSTGPLVLYNFTALEQTVARVATTADVVYAMVLDADGKIAAHSTRPAWVGAPLAGEVHERAAATSVLLIQETAEGPEGPAVLDVAVPIHVGGQRWGVARVGLSKRRMEAQIDAIRRELGLLTAMTLLLGGLGAALVARRIARPVRQLAAGADAIARGELTQRIEPSGFDEISQLAVAFNHMAAQLFQQRSEIEATHAELRRRFEELADLKSYTDSILGSLTSGVVTLGLDGRVAMLNQAAELLTGLFGPEVRGRYCSEVFANAPGVAEALMEALATRSAVTNVPLTLRRPSGASVSIEMSAAPLRGGEGKELGVVGVLRDVGEVRELEEQVRRADRLAALGTLAAGLAHEIKNPLTSLRTFARLASRKLEDERFRATLQRVVPREIERINAIVERLLELARPPRLSLERVQAPELLEQALDLYANQIESEGIVVVRDYARDCPAIQADPEQLYQVFVNLIANALEAMGRRGQLTIRAGWSDGSDTVTPGRRAAAQRGLKVEIQDTGGGIAPAEGDKVFNPFFTTKPAGTGLGLALTHKIIEDHGGSIGFRSAPGVGTTFRVLLPLAVERPGGRADGAGRAASREET